MFAHTYDLHCRGHNHNIQVIQLRIKTFCSEKTHRIQYLYEPKETDVTSEMAQIGFNTEN